MFFSYHPKYESIALEVKDFLGETGLDSQRVNFIVGGDGALFVYKRIDIPNFLISSTKFSKGYYSACFFEDKYKKKIVDYFLNPKNFEKEFDTIAINVNGVNLPENAINDVKLGRDANFKAILNGKEISDTGLLSYTYHGCNAWAKHFGGIPIYNELGYTLMQKRIPSEFEELTVEIKKFHGLEILIDGKGWDLHENYVHNSNIPIDEVFTKPRLVKEGVIKLKKGRPIVLVK